MPKTSSNTSSYKASIDAFNTFVGGGGLLVSALQLAIHDKEWQAKREQQRQNAANNLFGEVLPQLMEIGFGLISQNGGMVAISDQGFLQSQEVELQLIDGQRLLTFLQSQTFLGAKEQANLLFIAENLTKHLLVRSDLDHPSDSTLSLFGILEQLVQEYNRLGLGQAVAQLDNYLQMSRQGYLYEHLMIARSGIMSGKDYFGPSEWHVDSTAEYYRRRWEEAIGVVQKVHQEPRAHHLSKNAATKLRDDITYAREDIPRQVEQNPRPKAECSQDPAWYYWDQAPQFLATLDWAEQELDTL